jgi:hypothetical protein
LRALAFGRAQLIARLEETCNASLAAGLDVTLYQRCIALTLVVIASRQVQAAVSARCEQIGVVPRNDRRRVLACFAALVILIGRL